MSVRFLAVVFLATLLVLGCGGGDQADSGAEGPAPAAEPIAGIYDVSGITVNEATGSERAISGRIVLVENGPEYTATFDLTTTFPGSEEEHEADVIGRGAGAIEGRTLRGSAETQLVMAGIPGVDPNFAFIPRQVSTRIVSTTVTTIAADGSMTIEIQNRPAEGEEYTPTRTILRGTRVAPAGIGGGPEPAE